MGGPIIECPCGTVLRGVDDEQVVDEARRHAFEVHDLELTEDDARAMVRHD